MNIAIESVISNNIDRAVNTTRSILYTTVPRNKLYPLFVPSLQRMKHEGVFCEKVYDYIVDAILEASAESNSPEMIKTKLSIVLNRHYSRVIDEIMADVSLIRNKSDLLQEQRKIGYKVRFGELEDNVAKVILNWLRTRYEIVSIL